MLSNEIITFLKDLNKNNNRDWFKSNKKRYEEEVKIPFQSFVEEMITEIEKFDSEINATVKKSIFRIYRDTRFSKDKTPYKTHISAAFATKGKTNPNDPGYYFHLEPGRLMIGGGAYFMDKGGLQALRESIQNDTKGFQKVIENKNFVKHFKAIQGEANKRIPKEFKETFTTFPLIANKQFFFMAEHSSDIVSKKNFLKLVIDHFKAGYELNCYLREAFQIEQ